MKFRLGSAGEPTICSHCYDVLNEEMFYVKCDVEKRPLLRPTDKRDKQPPTDFVSCFEKCLGKATGTVHVRFTSVHERGKNRSERQVDTVLCAGAAAHGVERGLNFIV